MASFRWIILVCSWALTAASQGTGKASSLREARAGVVQDTLFLDGGMLATSLGSGLSTWDAPGVGHLRFTTPWKSTSNFTELLKFNKYSSDASLQAPHVSGFMFANNDEWYAFGGRSSSALTVSNTDSSNVLWYGVNDSTPGSQNQPIGGPTIWTKQDLNTSLIHITNGAGVSVTSENLGFYFSGLASPKGDDLGPLESTNPWQPDFPSMLATTMIKVDTSSYRLANWSLVTLPNGIARPEATLAWVPVGSQGALVVLGGAPFPADVFGGANCKLNASLTPLNAPSSSFMTNLSIYDIGGNVWYNQRTTGKTPPQLAQSCAMVASAPDNSSHNIYLYGGYAGASNKSAASDEVWILSLPTFTWINASSASNSSHGRTGHVCAKPYPDQMIVMGGTSACAEQLKTEDFADVFNLTTLQWTKKYDPDIWWNYSVPQIVQDAISSNTSIEIDSNVKTLFSTSYPGKQPQFYPYPKDKVDRKNKLLPLEILVPVLIVFLVLLIAYFWLRRKHRNDTLGAGRRSRVANRIFGRPTAVCPTPESEALHNGSYPGIQEVYGDQQYKPVYQYDVAELNNDYSPTLHSQITSPRHQARSPGSNSASAELQSHWVPAELPAGNNSQVRNVRPSAHPIQGGSSPRADAISSFKLSPSNNPEESVAAIQDDIVLNQVRSHSPRITHAGSAPPSPRTAAMRRVRTNNQEQRSSRQDFTDNKSSMIQRPAHARHTSSHSSGLSGLSSPSPGGNQQRSGTISPVRDSLSTVIGAQSPTGRSSTARSSVAQSPRLEGVTEDQTGRGMGQIRRKEVGSPTPRRPILRKAVGSGSSQTISRPDQ